MSSKPLNPTNILKHMAAYYRQPTKKLIYHLYQKGYTQTEIGKILGVTRQAIERHYPREGVNEEHEQK